MTVKDETVRMYVNVVVSFRISNPSISACEASERDELLERQFYRNSETIRLVE